MHELVSYVLNIFVAMDNEFISTQQDEDVRDKRRNISIPKDSTDLDELIMYADLA